MINALKHTAPFYLRELRLVGLVGYPYSGKSTYALSLASAFGWPIVSPDAIRSALHGERYIAQAEPHVWAMAHTMLWSLYAAGHNVVILDACNISHRRRMEWAKDTAYTTEWRCMWTPFNVCKARAAEANDGEIVPVIDRMVRNFDMKPAGDAAPPRLVTAHYAPEVTSEPYNNCRFVPQER